MKKLFIVAATALALSSMAHAASNTTAMKVSGKIINGACLPSIANNSVVDYGTILLSDLSATENNMLGTKDISLSITCVAPTKVAWSATDNRNDSVAYDLGGVFDGMHAFGVGKTTGGIDIGAYKLLTTDGNLMDGAAAELLSATNADQFTLLGTPVTAGTAINSISKQYYMLGKKGSNVPEAFTTATFPLQIKAEIMNTNTLAITDDTNIDGNATITLAYM